MEALIGLLLIVAAILSAARRPVLAPLMRRLPTPLWCYLLPALAVWAGWLPAGSPTYPGLASTVLPLALALLLMGVDLRSVMRVGRRAGLAAVAGAVGVLAGAAGGVWLLRPSLPTEAWKGAGALAGTWTGGTMNLLALRSILDIPPAIFAPLVLVDALLAYGWMALLAAAAAHQTTFNRWLGTADSDAGVPQEPLAEALGPFMRAAGWPRRRDRALIIVSAILLTLGARVVAAHAPLVGLISSATAWSLVLVTTIGVALSCVPVIRRLGQDLEPLGTACLYVVLAATGAQARLEALWQAPGWLAVGGITLIAHAAVLLVCGRCARIPLGLLATASQANIGGVVSAPMVGAIYHRRLVPVGLVLALAGNAVGTALGLLAASWAHALIP